LHSWAGIGLGKEDVDTLYTRITKNGRAKKNWKTTDLLVIDEISMATPDLLDKLNTLGKRLRKCSKPFGGIQLLFVGDFYQLPPVSKGGSEAVFAFESEAWAETIPSLQ
jgi:ATP-dependent DNA helicase PIF1